MNKKMDMRGDDPKDFLLTKGVKVKNCIEGRKDRDCKIESAQD